jgi:hypothetical protein
MKKIVCILTLLLLLTLVNTSAQACTGVFACDDTQALFGNNEDWSDPVTYIWTQSRAGAYDRVYLGYGDFWPQGGMNERGLCFDGFATVNNPVTPNPKLPPLPWNYVDIMMSDFSTVAEVADYLLEHDRTTMASYQLFFADSTGNSLIAEGDSLVWIEGDWQVCTNFYQTEPGIGGWPCWRYQTATAMLESMDQLDHDYIRDILDACHVSWTLYSNIFDLRQKTLRIFHERDYSTYVHFTFAQIMEDITTPMLISELMNMTSVQDAPGGLALPRTYDLFQNYPNPFNPSTTIAFDVPDAVESRQSVSLTVYDIRGRFVRTLIDSDLEPGSHKIHWNGQNDRGESVASGIYLYTLKAGEERFTRKMTVLK